MDVNRDINNLPSPFVLMKRCNRILEFESSGKPLHPLSVFVKTKPRKGKRNEMGELPFLAANHIKSAFIICADHVLLAKTGTTWRLPSSTPSATTAKKDACITTVSSLMASPKDMKRLLKEKEPKTIYENLDNFDTRTTRHAWVERSISKWILDKKHFTGLIPASSSSSEWVHKSKIQQLHINTLDNIIINQAL